MKRLVIVFTLLLGSMLSATSAQAEHAQEGQEGQEGQAGQQGQGHAGVILTRPTESEQVQQRLNQIKDRLALTPEQTEQVRPILATELQKLKALRATWESGGRRERRKLAREFKRIQDETNEELKKVLSKEQMKELKQLRDERRQQLRDGAAQRRP